MEQLGSFIRADGTILPLSEVEALAISYAVCVSTNRTAAAKALGIGRSTLYRKVEELGLDKHGTAARDVAYSQPRRRMGARQVRELVRSMADYNLATIQWVVEVRCGLKLTLGECAELLLK